MLRPRDKNYDQHVRTVVPKLTRILARAFQADSLEGACIGASTALTHMPSRLSVWSFGLAGSTILEVPANRLRKDLFAVDFPDSDQSEVGHVWVVAPPFQIVDATIALQNWGNSPIRPFIPDSLVVETEASVITPTVDDLISPLVQKRKLLESEGVQDSNLHNELIPNLSGFNENFPALSLTIGALHLRYCPTSPAMPNEPLEEIMSSSHYRRSAIEIWQQEVVPAFDL